MKRYCAGLLALALLGGAPVLAQGQPIPGGSPPAGSCEAVPLPALPAKTVCCPQHYVKDVKKVTYATGCETICPCFFHGLFHLGCGCDKGHCDHPIQARYLVKKVNSCPEDRVKCVPTKVPVGQHSPIVDGRLNAAELTVPTTPAAVVPGNKRP